MATDKLSCYNLCDQKNHACVQSQCRYWIEHKHGLNCTFITLNRHPKKKLTLTEISEIFALTRMRICQIEKSAINKCKHRLNVINNF